MLSPKGSPSMDNLAVIVGALRIRLGVKLAARFSEGCLISACFSNNDLTDYASLARIRRGQTRFEIAKTRTGREFLVFAGSGRDLDSRIRFPLRLPRIALAL
jgi:hypothetical protein